MKALVIIILVCFLIFLYCIIRILRNIEYLKNQNDMIYENKFEEIRKEVYPKDFTNNKILYDFEFKNSNIKDLPMSARLFTCLNVAEIEDIEQIIQYSRKELLGLRNFGKKSMFELEKLMDKYDLKFKQERHK